MIERELNDPEEDRARKTDVKHSAEDVGAKVVPVLTSKAFFGRPKAVQFATKRFVYLQRWNKQT